MFSFINFISFNNRINLKDRGPTHPTLKPDPTKPYIHMLWLNKTCFCFFIVSFLHILVFSSVYFVNILYNLGFLTHQFSVQRVQIYLIENTGQTITILMRGSSKLVLDEADRSTNDAWCAHWWRRGTWSRRRRKAECALRLRLTQWTKTLAGVRSYCD